MLDMYLSKAQKSNMSTEDGINSRKIKYSAKVFWLKNIENDH